MARVRSDHARARFFFSRFMVHVEEKKISGASRTRGTLSRGSLIVRLVQSCFFTTADELRSQLGTEVITGARMTAHFRGFRHPEIYNVR